MKKLLAAAAMAWNPVGEVRRRFEAGKLSLLSVLAPFIGIVIACNLIAVGGQRFFWARILNALGAEIPPNSLMDSDYALRALSTIGVLAPLGVAALLPRAVFDPPGRGATLATMLIVAAASAFYGAAISIPIYLLGGMLATSNVELALRVYTGLGLVAGVTTALLTLSFWYRATHYVLGLRGAQVAGITVVAVLAVALFVAFFLWMLPGST